MKAKSTVPEKGKRLESLDVEPSKQLVAQPNEKDSGIDLKDYPTLHSINDILENLYRTPEPSIIDCEDASLWAYKQASALLDYVDLAEKGLHADGSEFAAPVAGFVTESIHLQLDIVRLAGERLYFLCEAKETAEAQPSRVA